MATNGDICWAQGLISAYNWKKSGGREVVIDYGGLNYWLIDYCGGHLEVIYHEAVPRLIAEQTRL
ncbi:MAG: hypothetical protein ACT4NU_11385 [Chromatiales bacterium]